MVEMKVLIILFFAIRDCIVNGDVYTLGYLTGSQRRPGSRPGDFEYTKPGNLFTIIN